MKESQPINNDDDAKHQDPLASLDALFEKQRHHSFIDEQEANQHYKLNFVPESNNEFELTSSILLKKNSEADTHTDDFQAFESYTPDHFTDHFSQENEPDLQKNYLQASPLLTGLNASLHQPLNTQFLHHFSHEIGESLQACIKGLLAIHQQVGSSRFSTFNRNLQPIEDNPLRLGLSYEETLRIMYDDEKSAVHLAPAAAIAESLRHIRNHNEAIQYATAKALAQILDAFSPETLLKRFEQYRRHSSMQALTDENWAWSMYKQYFQELTSTRQFGFEKLYWEIVEQEYDRKIRSSQKEN